MENRARLSPRFQGEGRFFRDVAIDLVVTVSALPTSDISFDAPKNGAEQDFAPSWCGFRRRARSQCTTGHRRGRCRHAINAIYNRPRDDHHRHPLSPTPLTPAMTSPNDILFRARQRCAEQSLPYAGAVTPQDAWALLNADPQVKLIDVRTQAERDWVGRVSIAESQHLAVQWSLYPGGAINAAFVEQLGQCAERGETLLFLCRSGVRSRYAAKLATENGFINCYDILEGFEGDRDEDGHRKSIGGWCHAGLPWVGA